MFAASWGRCSLIGVQVMFVVVFFSRPLAFQFPLDGVGACPLVVCFCFCFASCFS